MRRLASLLALLAAILLVVPGGGALAAKPGKPAKHNGWLRYFPAVGVTCTAVATDPTDGSTVTDTTTVLAKTSKKIVIRDSGVGRLTALLLPRGRMRHVLKQTQRAFGVRERVTFVENYPSPAAALAHGSAMGRLTMTMVVPGQRARSELTSGQSMTMTADVRAVGVGSRTVVLSDAAATTVQAIGVRTLVRSLRLSANVKPAFARFFTRMMGKLYRSMSDTTWYAPGRGDVLDQFVIAGTALTATQTGCS